MSAAAPSRPVGLDALGDADTRRWAELAERALEPNPYLHPDFVRPAAQMLGEEVWLAVGGDWEAALAVRLSKRWRGLPLPGTLAWLHPQCFLGTPLVAPERPVEALRGLMGALGRSGSGGFAELDLTHVAGAFGEALDAALPKGAIRFGDYSRAAVERRPEPTYLEGRLSGKHRRAQRRLGRDLGAELGGELELVDRSGEAAAVDDFLALEDAGWKGAQNSSLLKSPGGPEFLHAVCAAFAERGALQLLFLQAGGRAAAARLNLRAGDTIFCFKIAFDETLRRFSPGLQLELQMLDHFHDDTTAGRMDSCADPGSEMFNRLWPDRRRLGGVLLPKPGPRGVAVRPTLRAVSRRIAKRRTGPPAA